MKKKLLAAVSIVALLGAAPVLAAQSQTDDSTMKQDSGSTTMQETKQDVKEGWDKTKKAVSDTAEDAADATKKGWDKTKNAVSNAADDATDATKEAYHDVKAFIFDKDSGKLDVSKVRINDRATADAMINTPVYNDNERVGVVKDIILNQDGKPVMVVIGDGDFFGLGKLAAFDYNSNMIRTNADGDFVMPLTEKSIDNAAEFSYDRKNTGDNVRVI
ncbi:MAG: PRC-barrel domain containing protein, partial [Alphaproteobacteria bacterium]